MQRLRRLRRSDAQPLAQTGAQLLVDEQGLRAVAVAVDVCDLRGWIEEV